MTKKNQKIRKRIEKKLIKSFERPFCNIKQRDKSVNK